MHAERKRTGGKRGRLFNYANNPTTLAGVVLTTVSAISIIAFVLGEMAGGLRNPYLGIFAYMILPAFFILGLILIPIGMWRRRAALIAAGLSIEERAAYPRLDFNDPQLRRAGAIVLLLTAVNAIIFGASSYLAVEHLETVEFCGTACHLMEPEYTAYQASPHSRVACVECHIGPGASWFVRSKLDGVRQVWKTTLDSYERPIGTPIHDLRPARETCEQCHWPAKHHGDKVKVFARFGTDETNRPSYSAMVLRTGGGSLEAGRAGGIHWRHIEADNRIRYVSQDDDREQIVWVELTTPDGERRVYTREGDELPAPPELELRARTMDCIDCHNRPTHLFEVPANALDQELAARPELVGLPYYKGQALAAIEGSYATREAGIEAVREAVLAYYRSSYPKVWAERTNLVETGAGVAAAVYARSVFPEMDTDWETHPNHIGHEQSPGCWRCHDEELATPGGEHVISMDCELCHVFLVEGSPTPPAPGGLLGGG
ncbi:MAG TPA: NapC/NirT family cytochrome c [Thermoanaerobaculia bacterium]|nr:NapC/NirT family cytochrome c [Thermoanaerobaculia bacterium]